MSFKIKIVFLLLLNFFSFSYGLCSPEDHGKYYSVDESYPIISDTTKFVFQVLLFLLICFIIKLLYNKLKNIRTKKVPLNKNDYPKSPQDTPYKCNYCKDSGTIEERIFPGEEGIKRVFTSCTTCQGTGWDLEHLPSDMCQKRYSNGEFKYKINYEVYNNKYKRKGPDNRAAFIKVNEILDGVKDGLKLCPRCKGHKIVKREGIIEGFEPSKGKFYVNYRYCPYCQFGKSFN